MTRYLTVDKQYLIPKYQPVSKLVYDDGLVAVHLVGEQFLRKVVQHELLNGSLHWTCAKVRIVTLFCQVADGIVAMVVAGVQDV